MTSLAEAQALDAADPLGPLRTRFQLDPELIYLDGNSLGPLPNATIALMQDAVQRQWGADLIRSWNDHDWIDAPQRIGNLVAPLIGAGDGEVIVADSVSVNIFKLLTALTRLRPAATHILTEAGNFPTDVHVAQGAAELLGLELKLVERSALADVISDDTAAVLLTHVHYRSGERYDIADIERIAASKEVPVIWDLSHSVGAVLLDLAGDAAHYAVGCGYKYLNGGPGAPGFVYVARDRQADLRPVLQGWMGHAAPFDFKDEYRPADGMQRLLTGTPPILSLLALEAGVKTFEGVDMAAVWTKSHALFDLFAALMAEHCPGFRLLTPTDPAQRGSHIAFAHEHAWPINNALISQNIIGDFRTPDALRFGLTPLYTRFEDVWRAVDRLTEIMTSGEWREPEYNRPAKVT